MNEDRVPPPAPSVMGFFRHPDYPGSEVHESCGYTWHDHGWIDDRDTTVCPSTMGPFPGQTICESGQAARALTDDGTDSPMSPIPVERLAAELRGLLEGHHVVTGDRIALHFAEEGGECVGAYNKLSQHRGSQAHFMQEWAQAILMLTMLGQHLLNEAELKLALETEMAVQRKRWGLTAHPYTTCPICGSDATDLEPYDIGSGPELACPTCEWCWGAEGQPLKPLEPLDPAILRIQPEGESNS